MGVPAGLSSQDKLPVLSLMALAGAMFVSQSIEFLPGGMIPLIASEFDRSVSEVGYLVSAFALTVVLSAVPSSWITRNASRKLIVVIALVGIGASAVLAAAAPTFELLLVARLIGGISHGLFWSSAAAYAANLVPASSLGRATAFTSAGAAIAGILGIPLGNALGYALGWRFAFLFMAVLGAVILVLVIKLLPTVDHRVPLVTGEIRLPGHRDPSLIRVVGLCVMIVIIVGGVGAYSTFGVVWLLEVGGLPTLGVPVVLALSGIAGAVGLAVIIRHADRRPWMLLVGATSTVIVLLVVLAISGYAGALWVTIAVSLSIGVAFAPIPTLLQAGNMRAASPQLRSFAAALQTTAINVGIGGGALIGGLSIEAFGLANLPLTGAAIVGAGLVALLGSRLSRLRSEGRP